MKESKAYKKKDDGGIWVKDLLHKDHWEVYKDKKSYEKGKRSFDVGKTVDLRGKMKTDDICEKYSKEKIKINTWIENDVFYRRQYKSIAVFV